MIIHDRREFAKFEKEKMNAKWDTVSPARRSDVTWETGLQFRCSDYDSWDLLERKWGGKSQLGVAKAPPHLTVLHFSLVLIQ